ncbi:cation-translocating P-type ATPase [Pseudoflavonifractor sp. An85]|uniref:cation-translocating P-type ATPase n=1 Tax=Pseudoflavonifractor sp. An85 TaxID=1965661 RepID=UPI000B36CE7E|nr:cation-translocating P-type ATPase [Pseudoflavonifractor sp. An85]OUN25973.1 ATPase P [Pseudoflavonifractor sp. An85]
MKRQKRQKQGRVTAQPRPIDRYFPTAQEGLNNDQVSRLAAAGWTNAVEETNLKSTGEIIRENTLTFFNLVFVVLAALLVLAGNFRDMFFLVIAIINSLIGIIQQLRSRATLSKLSLVAQARVKVVRGGQLGTVPVDKLVREDIVELGAGDQIPADGPVLEGQVTVNEALITGEADPIVKNPGDDLLSGSFVVSGKCRARMDHVGAASYAARLSHEAKADRGVGKSEMMKSLDRLIRVIGFALIPMGIALFFNEFWVQEQDFATSITSMVAALIGMIPEGLYLLTSVALAVSVMRLAQRKTLVHQMSAIETLARVDVLCVDKTGTVTQPEMSVQELVYLDPETHSPQQVEEVLGAYYQVMEADNDTARALAARFQKESGWQAQQVIPFTSANKWSAVVFQGRGSYVVGAPEFILKEDYKAIEDQVAPYQQAGCRVLLLAQCDTLPTQEGGLQGVVVPVALVVVANPIRPEAPETFRYFAKYGVDVKVISGDNPQTVSNVAKQAGIAGAERFVDAATLKEPGDYQRAVEEYTVFGRVTPDQKRKLVKALQKAGHTVAMTGDGVNDVLALKDADCGIAMASGAEAACQVAELVLLDSDFSAMPRVVEEGRRVINNIQRAAALYLVKNIMSVFLALITLFAGFPYPFVPIQLTLISALTIGIPSFVLALEPNHELVRGRFMHNVLRRALPGGLTNIVLIVGLELFTYAFTFQRATLSTLSTVTIGAVGLLVIYYVARPLDKKRWALLGSMTVAMIIAVLRFGSFFELTPLDLQSALVIVVFLMLTPSVIYAFETAFEWGSRVKAAWLKRRGGSRMLPKG